MVTKKRKIVLAVLIALLVLVLAVTVAYAAQSSQKKCYSYYSGGNRVAKFCYTHIIGWSGYYAKCNGNYINTYTYKSGWGWSGKAKGCSPSTWTSGWAVGAGTGTLKYYGQKKAVILCSVKGDGKGSYLYVRKYCKKY